MYNMYQMHSFHRVNDHSMKTIIEYTIFRVDFVKRYPFHVYKLVRPTKKKTEMMSQRRTRYYTLRPTKVYLSQTRNTAICL